MAAAEVADGHPLERPQERRWPCPDCRRAAPSLIVDSHRATKEMACRSDQAGLHYLFGSEEAKHIYGCHSYVCCVVVEGCWVNLCGDGENRQTNSARSHLRTMHHFAMRMVAPYIFCALYARQTNPKPPPDHGIIVVQGEQVFGEVSLVWLATAMEDTNALENGQTNQPETTTSVWWWSIGASLVHTSEM